MEKNLVQVEDLRTYFYTASGVSKAVDGVSFTVQSFVQFPQGVFQIIRAAVCRLDFPKVGEDRFPLGGELVHHADERHPDLILCQMGRFALVRLVLVLGVAAPDDLAVAVGTVPDL